MFTGAHELRPLGELRRQVLASGAALLRASRPAAAERRFPRVDFRAPLGAPALYAHDSLHWQVFKNPVSMFIGGVTAVLLELAEPRVRTGIWSYSSFSTDALARIRRTGLAALTTIYAPAETSRQLICAITRVHEGVRGTTPAGVAYGATDPVLLDWVQATVNYGFMEAYAAFARPLRDAERDRFYAESQVSARLFGAFGAPPTLAAQQALFERMRPGLEPHPIVHEFLAIMRDARILPGPLRRLQELLVRASVSILPGWLAARLELGAGFGLRPLERRFLQGLGAAAERVPLPGTPPVQACRRLGLPASYLHRR